MAKNAIQSVEELVKLHEGFRSKVYKCPAGYWTIGYGRNLEANGVSLDEAEQMLKNDLAYCEYQLAGRAYWKLLNDVRRAVCLDMMYNLGAAGYGKFIRFERALDTQNYSLAAQEMRNSKWFFQVGQRGLRLVDMMESGLWPK